MLKHLRLREEQNVKSTRRSSPHAKDLGSQCSHQLLISLAFYKNNVECFESNFKNYLLSNLLLLR